MPTVLGVLLLQPVAQLCDHGLVVGPLPVVDDEPAGGAGQQLVTESELTTIRPVRAHSGHIAQPHLTSRRALPSSSIRSYFWPSVTGKLR